MFISVVMAVYNGANSLGKALASVVDQSHRDWELIVVNDASTDATRDVLAEWSRRDSRIRFLENPSNLGLAASLNRAWDAALGAWIARIDADDECLSNRLESQLHFLEKRPEIDVLGGGAELVDAAGAVQGLAARRPDHEELVARIYRENPFIHPTVMMRKSFLQAMGGYRPSYRRAQDYDLWLRGRHGFRYANLEQPLIRYRVRVRPPWDAVYWGTRVLMRAVWHDRARWTAFWYPARFAVAGSLAQVGLRRTPPC